MGRIALLILTMVTLASCTFYGCKPSLMGATPLPVLQKAYGNTIKLELTCEI